VWSIGVSTAAIRLQAEHSFIRDKTVAIDLLPLGAIGRDPYVCRVTAVNANAYAIAEIHQSRFAGSIGPGAGQAFVVARNEFHPGVIKNARNLDLKHFGTSSQPATSCRDGRFRSRGN